MMLIGVCRTSGTQRWIGFAAIMCLLLGVFPTLHAQQQTDPRVDSLLRMSMAALAPTIPIQDASLHGTVRVLAGSTDENGTIQVKALAGGFSHIEFILPSRSYTEDTTFDNGPHGSWSDGKGKKHEVAQHNLVAGTDWFVPVLTIRRLLSESYVISYLETENRNGVSIAHFQAYREEKGLPSSVALAFKRLSQIEIYIDTKSLLPIAVGFNIHPDNNDSLDIPVEIRLSNYQLVNGVQVPFHVEKYVNNSLTTDIQIQSAAFNIGLTANTFTVQ